MMRYVADTAPFFNPSRVSDLELNPSKLGYVSEDPCRSNPPEGLLRIKNLKENIKKEYRNSCGALDPNTTGPFQQAMTTGIAQLAVRVGTVENFLKGLQSIERFTANDLRAGVLVDFIAEKTRTSLKNDYRSANFSRDFFEKIKKMYQDKIRSGYTIMDPITGARDERIHDSGHPDTISGFSALRNMTAQALATMREAMDEQFEEMGLQGSESNLMMETLLMGPDVPMISVPDWRGQPRFTKLGANNLSLIPRFEKYRDGANFVLERYVRVIPKPAREWDNEMDPLIHDELVRLFRSEEYTPRANGAFVDDDGIQVEVDGETEYTWLGTRGGGASAENSWCFGDWDTTSGVVMSHGKFHLLIMAAIPGKVRQNLCQAHEAYLYEPARGENPVNKWFDVYEGLRYVYVAPIRDDVDQQLTREEWLFPGDHAEEDLRQSLVEKTKAHYLEERHVASVPTADGAGWEQREWSVRTGTTPLASVEFKISDGKTMRFLRDEVGTWVPGVANNDAKRAEKVTGKTLRDGGVNNRLASQLLRSDEMRLLFRHLVPMKTLATLTYIYNTQAADFNALQIRGAFAPSKEAVRSAFYSMTPVAEDMKTAEDANLESFGGQAGMYKALSSISSNRPPIEFPDLWSIATATVPILIKGLATEMDPHYKLVNQIDQGLEQIGAGGLPTGMTWASVPFLWPINLSIPFIPLIGWGPPLTPLGAAAYSFGEFDKADKKRKKKQKREKKRSSNNNKCD